MQTAGIFVHLPSHPLVAFFTAKTFYDPSDHLTLWRCEEGFSHRRLGHMPVRADTVSQLVLKVEAEHLLLIGGQRCVELGDCRL
jgi:hypothetical protein